MIDAYCCRHAAMILLRHAAPYGALFTDITIHFRHAAIFDAAAFFSRLRITTEMMTFSPRVRMSRM